MRNLLVLFVMGGSLAFFSGCGGDNKNKTEDQNATVPTPSEDSLTGKTKELVDFKFFYTIANLPSPMEMISAIYENKVPFNRDLMNPTSNMENYHTAIKKAANYGIYGIDMAYTAFYGQNQDLLDYYANTRKLAERLNVQETFDKFTERFEKNSGNRDSLIIIIDKAYSETDNYLKNNNRYITAAHVLAGAILEAQYLSIELMKNQERNAQNEHIYEKIYNQKLYLENLISLFKELKSDKESAKLYDSLNKLKKSYDEIHTPEELNAKTLSKLSDAVKSVRSELIS